MLTMLWLIFKCIYTLSIKLHFVCSREAFDNKMSTTISSSTFHQLCFLLILGGNVGSQTVPTLTYECYENYTVRSINMSPPDYTHLKVILKNGFCEDDITSNETLLKCIQKTTGVLAYLLYEDDTHQKIVGGQNISYFELTCEESSVLKTVIAKLDPITLPTLPVYTRINLAPGNVTPVLSADQNSGIYIGQKIKLTMNVTGQYSLRPLTCSAYPEGKEKETIVIWTACNSSLSDNSVVQQTEWKKEKEQKSLSFGIYAFRFTGSYAVVISCQTMVCPDVKKDTDCKMECFTNTTTVPVGRKKRSVENSRTSNDISYTKYTSVSFHVWEQSNGGSGMTTYWYVCFLVWFLYRNVGQLIY